MILNDIKKELKEKGRQEALTKHNKIALEQGWFKNNAKECEKCHRTKELTLDHIIPKDILTQMGIDTDRVYQEENLRTLCRVCNNFKGNRLDFSDSRTKILLIKYLNAYI